jgi:hypothetical protein
MSELRVDVGYEPEWVREHIPRVLPPNWRVLQVNLDGVSWRSDSLGIAVILSGATEQDGKRWLHLSLSRKSRLPTWEDMRLVKNLFLGRERLALQVLVSESRWINIHPYVLHLWACVDGDPVPDFARGGDSI